MSKKIYLILSLSVIYVNIFAQNFQVSDLKIEWGIGENDYQKTGNTLSYLHLNNVGNAAFATKNWTIYFNFVRKVDAEQLAASGLKLTHHNGDLYSLKPSAEFKGIAPKTRLTLPLLTTEWLLNFSDAPAGFYIIFDENPNQGFDLAPPLILSSTTTAQTKRMANDNLPIADAKEVFKQNAKIKSVDNQAIIKIFPTPKVYQEKKGTFEINASTLFIMPSKFQKVNAEMDAFIKKMPKNNSKVGNIEIVENPNLGAEAYNLDINPDQIRIETATEKGAFYAIQSLKSLCPPNPTTSVFLPCLSVQDEPRFAYRGLQLDVARNFSSKNTIYKVLDVMALYKMNKFHFHLTDDEGWRLEIAGLPELTEVGAKRGHTLDNKDRLQPTYGSGFATKSGYYSQTDFIEILKYATAKEIEVIVELEFAGHARAAIKSMDARYDFYMKKGDKTAAEEFLLRDLADQSQYESVQQFNDNVVCVALPSTYRFLEKVTAEIVKMYQAANAPLTTIHIGGDEVPNKVWTQSPVSQQFIKEKKLDNEYALNYYFLQKANAIFKNYGLHVSGWEEIGLRKTQLNGENIMIPNPDFVNEKFTTYVWNNVTGWGAEDWVYRLANAGYDVVFTPVTNTYFDLAYSKHFDESGYYWGAFIDEEQPFKFAPTDYYKTTTIDRFGNAVPKAVFQGKDRLTDFGKQHLRGIQGCLWAENLKTEAQVEYQLLPKLLSLAERAWSKIPLWETTQNDSLAQATYQKDWADFLHRVGTYELPRLDYFHDGFDYRIPPSGAIRENNLLKINSLYPNFSIHYTTDGSEPNVKSTKYTTPVLVDKSAIVKVKLFNAKGRGGRTVMVE